LIKRDGDDTVLSMNTPTITVALRIPGQWTHPKELIEQLPEGYTLSPESLTMPDGTEVGFGAAKADNPFAQIFRSSCRQEPTAEEWKSVQSYKVNAFLMGPGGSLAAATTMMKAASAVLRAGGAGVFIDNSGLAHGAGLWLDMTDDGGPDAVSFAFVGIIGSKGEVHTVGMHVLGLRDVVMKRADADAGFDITEVIRYLARNEKPVDDGHIIADLSGPRFRAMAQDAPREWATSPMHNPFGRLRLVSMRDIAETN
jgi:hypothetical protein